MGAIYVCIAMPEKSDHMHRYEVGKKYLYDGNEVRDDDGRFICGKGSINFTKCMREYGLVYKFLTL